MTTKLTTRSVLDAEERRGDGGDAGESDALPLVMGTHRYRSSVLGQECDRNRSGKSRSNSRTFLTEPLKHRFGHVCKGGSST
jgi:hypothetical protein